MNKKGFTLIELLAVIVILAVIALIATPIILGIIENAKKSAFKDTVYGISQSAQNAYVKMMYATGSSVAVTYTYSNGTETSNPSGYTLDYSGAKPQNGIVNLNMQGKVSLMLHDGKYCATKDFDDSEITVEVKSLNDCLPVVDASRANAPLLAKGMTAVIWDGSAWVPASDIDNTFKQNWYDYQNKKWANAMTADGSLWVWIPRYAYQIATGYHTNTAGTINVKFLQGTTNTTRDGTAIATSPTYSGSSQTNYTKHPGFTFGTTELTGIWVAKFETSGTSTTLASKPGVVSYRNLTLGNMFDYTRNMEAQNIYGWDLASGYATISNSTPGTGLFSTDGNGLDTHVMKNTEWGAVAYLAQSMYGKGSEITINADGSYYTGGGSGTAYTTNTGQSTTDNIYGIYDMSGCGGEYVMANRTGWPGTAGISISNINTRYINNYDGYLSSNFGDAMYETSSAASGAAGWYGDYVLSVSTSSPWEVRGLTRADSTNAGTYSSTAQTGGAIGSFSWRIVINVATGL